VVGGGGKKKQKTTPEVHALKIAKIPKNIYFIFIQFLIGSYNYI